LPLAADPPFDEALDLDFVLEGDDFDGDDLDRDPDGVPCGACADTSAGASDSGCPAAIANAATARPQRPAATDRIVRV